MGMSVPGRNPERVGIERRSSSPRLARTGRFERRIHWLTPTVSNAALRRARPFSAAASGAVPLSLPLPWRGLSRRAGIQTRSPTMPRHMEIGRQTSASSSATSKVVAGRWRRWPRRRSRWPRRWDLMRATRKSADQIPTTPPARSPCARTSRTQGRTRWKPQPERDTSDNFHPRIFERRRPQPPPPDYGDV